MNRLHFLDNKLQFDYLLNNIRPRKSWSKWLKPDKIDNLELVKTYFGFGNEKAKEALEVSHQREHRKRLRVNLQKVEWRNQMTINIEEMVECTSERNLMTF